MTRVFLAVAGLFLFGLLFTTLPTAANPTSSVIVQGADSTWISPVSGSSSLTSLWQSVSSTVLVQYARSVGNLGLIAPPASIQNAFAAAPSHALVQYANSNQVLRLTKPGEGPASSGDEQQRAIFQYANAGTVVYMKYARTLFNDTQSPTVSDIRTEGMRVLWTTNEYADSTVLYGEESGVYPWQVNDPLYVKEHGLVLSNAVPGQAYFYKIRTTDRSGNVYESPEQTFTSVQSVYLPFVNGGSD
jgi:hypothetical protein